MILSAAHYTYLVESKWKERGGIILVAPPQALKTMALMKLENNPGVHIASDLNVQGLGRIKDQITGGSIRTIVTPDLQKLYERNPNVSSNVEGTIRQLIEEGFVSTSFQNSSIISQKARALFMSAATPAFYESKAQQWKDSGFYRRVLFVVYTITNPEKLTEAIIRWNKLEIRNAFKLHMPVDDIPHQITEREMREMRHWIINKQDSTTPLVLLAKIGDVLRFRYQKRKEKDRTMEVMREFSESLSGEGAEVKL